MAQPEARWVGEVVLSGPGSSAEGLAEELSGLIHLPVASPSRSAGLRHPAARRARTRYRHTVAAGLALGAAA